MKLLILLVPALLIAQAPHIPEPRGGVQKTPKPGYVRITLADGRQEAGIIARVMPTTISFERGKVCEEIERSEIAEIKEMNRREFGGDEIGFAYFSYMVVFIGPIELAYAIAAPVRMLFPPTHPPRGTWKAKSSTLDFGPSTVNGQTVTVKRGHYAVSSGRLRMTLEGEPEKVLPFRISCRSLVIGDGPGLVLQTWPKQSAEPIVGEWTDAASIRKFSMLKFKSDGILEHTDIRRRVGGFEMHKNAMTIRWEGGEEWKAEIQANHILVQEGGTTMRYRYSPWPF